MYDYVDEMKQDITRWITATINVKDYPDRQELQEYLDDSLWAEDEITGNGTYGGYFEKQEDARISVLDNFELCVEALREFCVPMEKVAEEFLDENWKYFDSTIRCYLLWNVIDSILEDIYEEDK